MKQLQRLKGSQRAVPRPCMQGREVLTVICNKMFHFILPSPLLRKKIPNTNRNHRQSQPSRHAKPLVSTHRCKVNHAVASQSVILSPLLRDSDKPVAKACVKGL
jgi:hypothetical protein